MIFDISTYFEVEFRKDKKKRLVRLYIDFPEEASLSTEHFRAVVGQNFDKVMPPGVGASISIKEFWLIEDFSGVEQTRLKSLV